MTSLAEIAENSARARRVDNLETNILPEKGGIWVLTPQDSVSSLQNIIYFPVSMRAPSVRHKSIGNRRR